MNKPPLESWRSEDGGFVLHYDPRVLEGIRGEASAAGEGIEAGGILLGSLTDAGEYVLQSWWPVRRDHARSASFRLSSGDVAALAAHVEVLSGGGTGRVLGWFTGRRGGETALRAEEQHFHASVFPASAPLFMIVSPGQEGETAFRFYRISGGDRPAASLVRGCLALPPAPVKMGRDAEPRRRQAGARNRAGAAARLRRWALPALALVAGLVFVTSGWRVWQSPRPRTQARIYTAQALPAQTGEPLQLTTLHVNRMRGRLEITWEPIIGNESEVQATLVLTDQGRVTTWRLSAEDLARGRMRYRRAAHEVQVLLRVEPAGRPAQIARAHYVAGRGNE